MYAGAYTVRTLGTDRAPRVFHSPHTDRGVTLGQFRTNIKGGATPAGEPAAESHTVLYVGIGLGALAVLGTVYYLATKKKGRRR